MATRRVNVAQTFGRLQKTTDRTSEHIFNRDETKARPLVWIVFISTHVATWRVNPSQPPQIPVESLEGIGSRLLLQHTKQRTCESCLLSSPAHQNFATTGMSRRRMPHENFKSTRKAIANVAPTKQPAQSSMNQQNQHPTGNHMNCPMTSAGARRDRLMQGTMTSRQDCNPRTSTAWREKPQDATPLSLRPPTQTQKIKDHPCLRPPRPDKMTFSNDKDAFHVAEKSDIETQTTTTGAARDSQSGLFKSQSHHSLVRTTRDLEGFCNASSSNHGDRRSHDSAAASTASNTGAPFAAVRKPFPRSLLECTRFPFTLISKFPVFPLSFTSTKLSASSGKVVFRRSTAAR